MQVKELSKKLSRANGIFSKLRHYVPKTTMLSVYYAFFYSHLTYGSLVWSLTSQKNLDIIFTLQKKSIRILNSVNYNAHMNPLFLENKIIKFPDIIKSNQLLFANQFLNNNLPEDLKNMIKFSNCIHDHSTRIYLRTVGFLFPKLHQQILVFTQLGIWYPLYGMNSPGFIQ